MSLRSTSTFTAHGFLILLLALVANPCSAQNMMPGPAEGLQFRFRQQANAVRMLEVVPAKWTKSKRRLIVFATPNGNTLEQSYGARAQDGRDWHFDIQHVGAQVRYAQSHSDDVDLALVMLQAGQLSWPAFRQSTDGADKQIRRLIESLQAEYGADETYLTCHSGGGSLIWGWMNAHEELPTSVTRIALLDANYSFSDQLQHGDMLLKWLRTSSANRLLVMAYDDRQVEYQGKKIVSEDGGTYRATERMITRFEKEEPGERSAMADMQAVRFLDGRALMLRHPNPQNVILHTALVGELNGLPYACVWGQSQEAERLLAGPRCYAEYISGEELSDPTRGRARRAIGTPVRSLNLPPRTPDAETGTAFIARIASLDRSAREQAVYEAISAGNVPDWSRQLIPIEIAGTSTADAKSGEKSTHVYVQQDYLAIGANDDAVRMPMTPATAWKLCQLLDCSLPTAQLCDEIFSAAQVRLTPQPMTNDRDQVKTFLEHHQLIEQQLRGKDRDGIIVGHKKDVINSQESLQQKRVIIYGWHYPSGVPIQPVYAGHVDWYTDYSHGVRLISK